MGMLINGTWTTSNKIIKNGEFIRDPSRFTGPVELAAEEPAARAPRYWLIASNSCPWSHGTTIVRALHKLGSRVGLHIAHGPRTEGYAMNGGADWDVPGTTASIVHLHQLYTLADPTFTGRSTLPVLWDAKTSKVLSNDSRSIMGAFNHLGRTCGVSGLDFAPDEWRGEIEALNDWLYSNLNNAVYCAGFAETQDAFDEAVDIVFGALDALDDRLGQQRYLLGNSVTLADWRLFATLVRFDSVYAILHRCCRKRLVDYKTLWAYVRDLYGWPGVAGTVDFTEIMRGSYLNDTANNPYGIVPQRPDADWQTPHDRERIRANTVFERLAPIAAGDRSAI